MAIGHYDILGRFLRNEVAAELTLGVMEQLPLKDIIRLREVNHYCKEMVDTYVVQHLLKRPCDSLKQVLDIQNVCQYILHKNRSLEELFRGLTIKPHFTIRASDLSCKLQDVLKMLPPHVKSVTLLGNGKRFRRYSMGSTLDLRPLKGLKHFTITDTHKFDTIAFHPEAKVESLEVVRCDGFTSIPESQKAFLQSVHILFSRSLVVERQQLPKLQSYICVRHNQDFVAPEIIERFRRLSI